MVPTLYISKEQVLFGNLAFVKIDEEGYTVGLDKEDIERLLRYIENQIKGHAGNLTCMALSLGDYRLFDVIPNLFPQL